MISINLSIILLCYIVVMSTLRGVVIIINLKEKYNRLEMYYDACLKRYDDLNETMLDHECEYPDEVNPLLK